MISLLDMFTIGIGPGSSHTVGPMRAARVFQERLTEAGFLERAGHIRVTLYGSLALTAKRLLATQQHRSNPNPN